MAKNLRDNEEELDDIEDDDEEQNWDDWNVNEEGEGGDDDADFLDSELLCLFCNSKYSSSDLLFKHCSSIHHFNFQSIRKSLDLDFYASLKLINYIRSQVAQNTCWICGVNCHSKHELQNHLHETLSFKKSPFPWEDDMYLKPFMQEDPLLFSFGEDDGGDEFVMSVDEEEVIRNLSSFEKICIDYDNDLELRASDTSNSMENGMEGVASACDSNLNTASRLGDVAANGFGAKVGVSYDTKSKDANSQNSYAKVVDNERIVVVNKSYFGSYGSFGIHREMISDKVRTDAYKQAIVDNPSLLRGSVVLDVGCGTGILSLFAAQAGASRVIAVEASDKMAAVASQIAKDNGLLWSGVPNESSSGVIKVTHGMVEDLVESGHIQPHSVDVLLSEWMGYCLLYESMLSSVLVARDHWLKPGGAILPDTATMFVAGFGKGGTSIPFWENVYGFNMSCVGNEVVEDAARVPIVDVVDGHDLVTNTAVLQRFDLVTMKPEEVDFTATIELEPKLDGTDPKDLKSEITWCYGIVLWFETSFTSRFCKEAPTILSTSPYTPRTHWSQTILTFHEPIAIGKPVDVSSSAVGTDACPAVRLNLRISIARGLRHRSIDISLEMAGIGLDGRKRNWPVQIFNLC